MVLLIAANEQLGASQCGCFCSQEADGKGGELQVCERSSSSREWSSCGLGSLTPMPASTPVPSSHDLGTRTWTSGRFFEEMHARVFLAQKLAA